MNVKPSLFPLLFSIMICLLNCKSDKKNSLNQEDENSSTIDFSSLLLCGKYTWNESYFITADHGCLYSPKDENPYGNIVFYLFPKSEDLGGDQMEIESRSKNYIKENYEIILTLIEPNYLNHNPQGDPVYYQIADFWQKIFRYNEAEDQWDLVESMQSPTAEELVEKIQEIRNSSRSVNIKVDQIGLSEFIKPLPQLKFPISKNDLVKGKPVSDAFFFYEKGNDYYTLENLVSYGHIKNENSISILYGFDLIGEGEGFATDMIILSQFNGEGNFVQDVILYGHYGGEGFSRTIEKLQLKKDDLTIDVRDEFHGSDTGLSFPIKTYKIQNYHMEAGMYKLTNEVYAGCQHLDDLSKYKSVFRNAAKDKSLESYAYGYSHQLENYLACVPITAQTVTEYNDIGYYLEQTHNYERAVFLLEKIIQQFPDRVVAYLNFADALWAQNNFDLAKSNYETYISLMKSQGKDLSLIPQRVYDRTK